MNHVGGPDVFGDFDGGARKLAKAFGIVGKIARSVAVQAIAVEEAGVVDEKVSNAVKKGAVSDGRKAQAWSQGNGEAGHHLGGCSCSMIARQNHGDFATLCRQRLRQRFDHVRQAAGLRKWQTFRGYEKNPQFFLFARFCRAPRSFSLRLNHGIRRKTPHYFTLLCEHPAVKLKLSGGPSCYTCPAWLVSASDNISWWTRGGARRLRVPSTLRRMLSLALPQQLVKQDSVGSRLARAMER